ncbi:hypothetical protein CI610_02036 [invertebrate metagenome]|uniref:Uncharacterized protein n=1 Tax=invertebrate metagenome TaxID=1711999 RepID=A0A2H9T726_9ZZZZ
MTCPDNNMTKPYHSSFGLSLKSQLLLLYGLLLSGLSITSGLLLYQENISSGMQQAQKMGQLLSKQTANASINMLITGDRLSLNVLLNQLVQNDYIAAASLYSIDNQRIASSGYRPDEPDAFAYREAIIYQDVIIGYVTLYLNLPLLQQRALATVYPFGIISLFLLITGLLLVYFFAENLTISLKKIERQLSVLLPDAPQSKKDTNELKRIASLTEGQLLYHLNTSAQKSKQQQTKPEPDIPNPFYAAVGYHFRNVSTLQTLLTPDDFRQHLKRQQVSIHKSATLYNGIPDEPAQDHGCIFFIGDSYSFVIKNAIACALHIACLRQEKESTQPLKIKTGLCIVLGQDQQELRKKSQELIRISQGTEIYLYHEQLPLLPSDLCETAATDCAEICYISHLNSSFSKKIKKQAIDLMDDNNK